VLYSVTLRILSDHLPSKGHGIGNRNRMENGGSSSVVIFDVGSGVGYSRGVWMVTLTPLWSRNAWDMVCVSLVCSVVWRGLYITKWSIHDACDVWCVGV
jgi:hypothetical protein